MTTSLLNNSPRGYHSSESPISFQLEREMIQANNPHCPLTTETPCFLSLLNDIDYDSLVIKMAIDNKVAILNWVSGQRPISTLLRNRAIRSALQSDQWKAINALITGHTNDVAPWIFELAVQKAVDQGQFKHIWDWLTPPEEISDNLMRVAHRVLKATGHSEMIDSLPPLATLQPLSQTEPSHHDCCSIL